MTYSDLPILVQNGTLEKFQRTNNGQLTLSTFSGYQLAVELQTTANRLLLENKIKLIWLSQYDLMVGEPFPMEKYDTIFRFNRWNEYKTNVHEPLWTVGNDASFYYLTDMGFLPDPGLQVQLVSFNNQRLDPETAQCSICCQP